MRKNQNVKPGEQVASNRALHNDMQLVENANGEYDAVVFHIDRYTLIRGEYYPIGRNFHYPKIWGRKYAATKDKRKSIQEAERELTKLQKCLDKVNQWSDTDL
jgi:hypothetical protein